jgi:spore maturation protein CgeB
MSRNIIYIHYHLVITDVTAVFALLGFNCVGLSSSTLSIEVFDRECKTHQPAWVFSINFSPEIAVLCSRRAIPYVSWTIDPLPLNRQSIASGIDPALCLIFAHDLSTVAKFGLLGVDSRHLLLAAPANRRHPIQADLILDSCRCEASFVGSSLVDEVYALDRWLAPRGGDSLSVRGLLWVSSVMHEVEGVVGLTWLEAAEGPEALPPFLRELCHTDSDCAELIAKLNGVVSAFYRQRGVASMLRYPGPVAVWGDAGWTDYHPHYRGPADHGQELTQIYCASAVNLDIPRLYQRQTVTMRIFDILACGGFLLAERSDAMEAVFTEDVHLAFYDSHKALPEVIERWVADPVGREKIAAAGRAEVLAKHQIEQRVSVILEAVAQKGW